MILFALLLIDMCVQIGSWSMTGAWAIKRNRITHCVVELRQINAEINCSAPPPQGLHGQRRLLLFTIIYHLAAMMASCIAMWLYDEKLFEGSFIISTIILEISLVGFLCMDMLIIYLARYFRVTFERVEARVNDGLGAANLNTTLDLILRTCQSFDVVSAHMSLFIWMKYAMNFCAILIIPYLAFSPGSQVEWPLESAIPWFIIYCVSFIEPSLYSEAVESQVGQLGCRIIFCIALLSTNRRLISRKDVSYPSFPIWRSIWTRRCR